MKKIKIAIIGIGNCASSLIQGIHYYKNKEDEDAIGLMHWKIGDYTPSDIEVVAAFDIDKRKVGKPINKAIFAKPNCTTIFQKDIPETDVKVSMGHVLDGVASHMANYKEDYTFVISNEESVDVVETLKSSGAEILLNFLPVGSEKAARFYAQCALDAEIAYINCMPVFIASDKSWSDKFKEKGIPIIGDDIKAQIGATITHRTLANLFMERGVKLERTYQLNTGGNTDFLNMLNRERLDSKKESKTEAVQSVLKERMDDHNIHIGPSDYVPWQKDNKLCFLRMEGKTFGDVPMNIELRLSVEDSPNSAGCVIDAIRCCKIAIERNISGELTSISSYIMKHPTHQFSDDKAFEMVEEFIQNKRER
ncbi:inositol-3-phosphate synthase [Methanobrevibacter filiformis]|uniref:Inositol-3-phosphate synthase n=1 Tax=Methanobrevibacter filiformis TaxID=55758 RepID=A0A165YUE1_9EURY|nr:inositol-3-phosphate synthase [Methanobrevibacter filiformis]KZX09879.1 inositol-3-phosphate synthase [Methanobrevibacter filiformis]